MHDGRGGTVPDCLVSGCIGSTEEGKRGSLCLMPPGLVSLFLVRYL